MYHIKELFLRKGNHPPPTPPKLPGSQKQATIPGEHPKAQAPGAEIPPRCMQEDGPGPATRGEKYGWMKHIWRMIPHDAGINCIVQYNALRVFVSGEFYAIFQAKTNWLTGFLHEQTTTHQPSKWVRQKYPAAFPRARVLVVAYPSKQGMGSRAWFFCPLEVTPLERSWHKMYDMFFFLGWAL